MRISDWSSDVCSSDLSRIRQETRSAGTEHALFGIDHGQRCARVAESGDGVALSHLHPGVRPAAQRRCSAAGADPRNRSEEHTSELQSLMRISYAVFCLKKKKTKTKRYKTHIVTYKIT